VHLCLYIDYHIMKIFISVHLLLVLDFLSVTTAQSSLEDQVNRNEKRINGLIREANSTVIEINQNVSSVTERVIDLEELNDSLNSTAGELIEDIGRLDETTMELNEAVVNVEGEVTVLTGSTDNLEGEVATLQLAIADLTGNIAELEALREEVDRLEEVIGGNIAELEALREEVDSLEEVIGNLQEVTNYVQIQNYGIVSPDGNSQSSSYKPYNILDGNKRTMWQSEEFSDTGSLWFKLTFPNDAVISRIALYGISFVYENTNQYYVLGDLTFNILNATDGIVHEDNVIGGEGVVHFSVDPPVTGRVIYVQKMNPDNEFTIFGVTGIEVYGEFQYD